MADRVRSELMSVLRSIKSRGQTGKFHVFARLDGGLRNATVEAADGELTACTFQDLSGWDAVLALVHSRLSQVTRFLNISAADRQSDPGMITIDELLKLLRDERDAAAISPVNEHGVHPLHHEVILRLQPVLGDGATAKAEELAVRFPPDRQGSEFVRASAELAAAYVGKAMAENMFDSIRHRHTTKSL